MVKNGLRFSKYTAAAREDQAHAAAHGGYPYGINQVSYQTRIYLSSSPTRHLRIADQTYGNRRG
jgi:hypothetical protein